VLRCFHKGRRQGKKIGKRKEKGRKEKNPIGFNDTLCSIARPITRASREKEEEGGGKEGKGGGEEKKKKKKNAYSSTLISNLILPFSPILSIGLDAGANREAGRRGGKRGGEEEKRHSYAAYRLGISSRNATTRAQLELGQQKLVTISWRGAENGGKGRGEKGRNLYASLTVRCTTFRSPR